MSDSELIMTAQTDESYARIIAIYLTECVEEYKWSAKWRINNEWWKIASIFWEKRIDKQL